MTETNIKKNKKAGRTKVGRSSYLIFSFSDPSKAGPGGPITTMTAPTPWTPMVSTVLGRANALPREATVLRLARPSLSAIAPNAFANSTRWDGCSFTMQEVQAPSNRALSAPVFLGPGIHLML